MNSDAPITVHSWLPGTENKQFISLQAAIEYAREQLDEIPEIEILIRTAGIVMQSLGVINLSPWLCGSAFLIEATLRQDVEPAAAKRLVRLIACWRPLNLQETVYLRLESNR